MTLADPDFPSSAAFDLISAGLGASEEARQKYVKQAKVLAQFDIKNKDGKVKSWYLDVKEKGIVGEGKAKKPDVTLIVSDADFAALAAGKANAQKLFMGGKLKVKGNVMKATALDTVLKAARTEAKL